MSSSCQQCERRQSLILLRNQYRSGLGDAQLVLMRVGQLAGSLCARLAPQPPCEQLMPGLNLGNAISCDASWSRYFHIAFGDNSSLLSEQILDNHRQQYTFVSDGVGDIVAQADAAAAAQRSAHPFIWVINHSYYTWGDRLHEHLRNRRSSHASSVPPPLIRRRFTWRNGTAIRRVDDDASCGYVRFEPSIMVQRLATDFIHSITLAGNSFTALHVRRGVEEGAGGASRRCSTKVGNVAAYVDCMTGAGTGHRHPPDSSHPLVLFSDENDPVWRQGLLRQVSHLRSVRLQPVDGDERLRTLARQAFADGERDNFLIYAAANLVRQRASRSLELRRCLTGGSIKDSEPHVRCLVTAGVITPDEQSSVFPRSSS